MSTFTLDSDLLGGLFAFLVMGFLIETFPVVGVVVLALLLIVGLYLCLDTVLNKGWAGVWRALPWVGGLVVWVSLCFVLAVLMQVGRLLTGL